MAIRRCPYCKAMIDESLEYCSNCGTQLLFPEDEAIEEDIPGEKIIDVDEEEEEPEPQKKNKSEEDQPKTPEELTENPEEEDKKDDEDTAEMFEELVESEEEKPKKKEEDKEESDSALETGDIPTDELPIEKAIERELGRPPLVTPPTSPDFMEKAEEALSKATPEDPGEIEELSEEEVKPPPKPKKKESAQKKLTFDTGELEKAVDTTEKEKEEIERFLDSIKRDREEKADQDAPVQEEIPRPQTDDEEAIPPWAAKIKETPAEDMASLQDETREELLEEDKDLDIDTQKLLEEEAAAQDSGVGLPEDVDQQDMAVEIEAEKEERVLRKKPPSRFANWLKSKAFDVVFIGAFWLIGLWIASRVMDVSLFRLIAASAISVLVFYGILLVSYLFLFHLFLGETLGDHLFFQD
jgi:hypothetical protein